MATVLKTTKKGEEVLQLSDGSLMLYDHLLNIDCHIVDVWKWTNTNKSPTVADLQTYCEYHNEECKYTLLGKHLRFIHSSDYKIHLAFCGFHWLQNSFRRFTVDGEEIRYLPNEVENPVESFEGFDLLKENF